MATHWLCLDKNRDRCYDSYRAELTTTHDEWSASYSKALAGLPNCGVRYARGNRTKTLDNGAVLIVRSNIGVMRGGADNCTEVAHADELSLTPLC